MKRKSVFTWLLAGTTALVPTQALAMPIAIANLITPFIISSPVFFLGPAAINAVALGIGYGVAAAAAFGLQAALRPDMPEAPKPEDGKINFKQSVPSLSYVLGRVRKGGDYVFLEEKNGIAYHIVVWAAHRIQGFRNHFFHDEKVTLDGNGYVTAPAHFVKDGSQKQRVLTRLGRNAETAYNDVVATFGSPIWTNNHRGDGLASIRFSVDTVSQEDYLKVYPNQMPKETAEGDGALLFDPRNGQTSFSTNLALERLWHLTHPVGGKLSVDDLYLPEWERAADVCDEQVTNREGNQEARYHGGFWFRSNNDPVQIGRLIDQAAEMVVYERADGLVGVHPGEYVAPDIRLTEADIVALKFTANRSEATNVVAVRGQYTDPTDSLYVTRDAAPYGNPYSEDEERTRTIENQAVQSHNHMARLEKITFIRANAPRVNVVAHYQAAKHVPYRRFVRVHVPPRLDEAVIELTGRPRLDLRNLRVEFQGIVVPPTLYEFDASIDEGQPGSPVIPVEPTGVPDPVNFGVTINNEVIAGGDTAAYALATWDHISDAIMYELEWEPSGGGTKQTVLSSPGADQARSGYLPDGQEYRFRLRAWSGGQSSDWTPYVIRTATADPTPPDPVTGVGATGGTGQIEFQWDSPNSANYFACQIYLNTVDDFGTATLVATEYGAPNEPDNRTVTSLTAGTYFGWLVAINASGVGAAEEPTGSITVT